MLLSRPSSLLAGPLNLKPLVSLVGPPAPSRPRLRLCLLTHPLIMAPMLSPLLVILPQKLEPLPHFTPPTTCVTASLLTLTPWPPNWCLSSLPVQSLLPPRALPRVSWTPVPVPDARMTPSYLSSGPRPSRARTLIRLFERSLRWKAIVPLPTPLFM